MIKDTASGSATAGGQSRVSIVSEDEAHAMVLCAQPYQSWPTCVQNPLEWVDGQQVAIQQPCMGLQQFLLVVVSGGDYGFYFRVHVVFTGGSSLLGFCH